MNDLQKQIELLEAQRDEAELLGQLACNPDTRTSNRQLADELREAALRVRSEAVAIAALSLPGPEENPRPSSWFG